MALLKIGKSQFGTKVWLNGKEVGEHLSCWTAGYFNLTDAMNWSGENQLIVRIGAHPAVLPENIPGAGTYSSKHKWTPGIYDDVSLILCDNPVIETHPGGAAHRQFRSRHPDESQELRPRKRLSNSLTPSALGKRAKRLCG